MVQSLDPNVGRMIGLCGPLVKADPGGSVSNRASGATSVGEEFASAVGLVNGTSELGLACILPGAGGRWHRHRQCTSKRRSAMTDSSHLWAVGYDEIARAGQIRDEIVKLGWEERSLILQDV